MNAGRVLVLFAFLAGSLGTPVQLLAAGEAGLSPTLTSTRRLGLKNDQTVGELFRILDSGQLHAFPRAWFRGSYDPSLPDLIFYLPQGAKEPIVQLVQDGETKQRLRGARHIWTMVFVETPSDTSAESGNKSPLQSVRRRHELASSAVDSTWGVKKPADPPAAEFRLEPLDYQRGLGDLTVVKGLAGLFSKVPLADAEGPEDDTAEVTFTEVGSVGTRSLIYAVNKFSLRENSVDRVRLALGDTLRTYATFGNYDDSKFGLSFALVVGLPAQSTARLRQFDFQPYLPIHRFLRRPERPRLFDQAHLKDRQHSVAHSIFVAPTVSEHPFEDIMVGYGAWDLFGTTGIVIGPEFRKGTRADSSTVWRTRWSIGLSISLR